MNNEPKPDGAQPASSQPETSNESVSIAQPVQPVMQPVKKRSKILYLAVMVVLLLVVVAAYYFAFSSKNHDSVNTAATNQSNTNLTGAKKQYFLNDTVAGYVNYKPSVFKEIQDTKLPTIPPADPSVNVIIVQANIVGFNDSGLYLYDIGANKTYQLTKGGGSPRIMSNHYLLYGFDTGSGANKRLGGKLLDLQTGKTQTIFSNAPEKVPGTVCCSVSPDGYKAAFVQKDKVSVWDIRTAKMTDYAATVNPIDPHFSRTATNDYNVEISYARPVWLDNDSIVYTDKPAATEVGGNQPKAIVDNTLYQLNTKTGKSTPIKTDASGIYDIYVVNDAIFINAVPTDQDYAQISIISKGSDGYNIRPLGINNGHIMISPTGDRIYTFDSLDGPNAYTYMGTSDGDFSNSPNYGAFNPLIKGVAISGVLPQGWLDDSRMLLSETDTAGVQTHEYIAVYNVKTDKVEQYIQIN